jgi:hypothetical protein
MFPNSLASENLALLATLDPVSQGAATVTTGWVDASKFAEIVAIIGVGVMTATSTVDAKLQQATDGAGTGAKDIASKAITQLLAAGGNNRQAMINLRTEQLDVNNSFRFVRLSITVAAAASLLQAALIGVHGRARARQPTRTRRAWSRRSPDRQRRCSSSSPLLRFTRCLSRPRSRGRERLPPIGTRTTRFFSRRPSSAPRRSRTTRSWPGPCASSSTTSCRTSS